MNTRFDTDDQVAFFDTLYAGAKRAETASGFSDHQFSVAGHPVSLRIAGNGFAAKLPTAFSHLAREFTESPALTIHAWDDASTGTQLPKLLSRYLSFVEMHCFDFLGPRNEMRDFHGERIRALMHLDPMIVSLYDPVRSMALYWTPDVSRIPIWDWGTPLRIIINEWARLQNLFLVHCGAVGTTQGGVIFAGKSGSGKSTSALACLDSDELKYAGDDYSLLSLTPKPYVHSLYCSAKLKGAGDFERFSHLLPLVANREQLGEQKALIFLNDAYGEKLIRKFPLRAIVVPRITGRQESTVEPCSPVVALKALAPSTMLQLPGEGKVTMQNLSALVRSVPCYTLNAGHDASGISTRMDSFLRELLGEA